MPVIRTLLKTCSSFYEESLFRAQWDAPSQPWPTLPRINSFNGSQRLLEEVDEELDQDPVPALLKHQPEA